MTIAEKILRAKDDYDAVFEAGKRAVGEVLKFTDVSSTAYRSIVPNGVEPFARVNKIGGMSYKSKNLLRYPYAVTTLTSYGITFTDNGDGSITLNGTNDGTNNSAFHLSLRSNENAIKLPAGTYSASLGYTEYRGVDITCYDGVNYNTVSINSMTVTESKPLTIYVQVPKGRTETFSNFTVYPMLNEGTTALPYEPYFEGLRSASVSELKSKSANLIPFPYVKNSETIKGVTFTPLADGGISVVGTPTGEISFQLWNPESNVDISSLVIGGKYYTISGGKDNVVVNVRKAPLDSITTTSSWIESSSSKSNGKEMPVGYSVCLVGLYISSSVTTEINTVIYPMLNEGKTALPYTKYKGEIDILAVPEAVKSLEGYGLGVNSEYYNYIDFNRKVFVQNVYRKVFDGTENWNTNVAVKDGTRRISVRLSPIAKGVDVGSKGAITSNLYNTVTVGGDIWYSKDGVGIYSDGTHLIVYDENYNTTDVSLWKTHLAELYASGNPLVIDYALATPIETDISAYLTDEYIEVEGGGTVTVVNEFGYDAPTNISYLTDTQGG